MAGFWLAAAILIAATLWNLQSTRVYMSASQERGIARKMLVELDRLLMLLQDAETGQRGYLLTGRSEYLAPYTAAQENFEGALAEIRRLNREGGGFEVRLNAIEEQVRTKLNELAETLSVRRRNGAQAAIAIMQTDRGQNAMDELRRLIGTERTKVTRFLDGKTEVSATSARHAMLGLVIGGILSFVLLGVSWRGLKTEVQERQRINDRLADEIALHAATVRAFRDANTVQQAILDSANYAIVSTDIHGVVATFNAGAERMLGYTESEVCGKTTPMPWHVEEEVNFQARELERQLGRKLESPFEAVVWKATQGFADEREWTLVRKDGSRFTSLLSLTALRRPEGDIIGFLGVFSDLTERRRIEAQLNHSRERFELAARGAIDGIWDWNVRTGYFYISDRWFELLGYQPGELPQKLESWYANLHPDEREKVIAAMLAHLDRREPYDIECRLRAKDGSYRWFRACGQASWDAAGVPQRMAGSLTDITERRFAEEKLRFSEERFRSAIEYSAIGIALVGLDGRWLQVNRAMCSILGYTAEELYPLTFQDITHPDDLETDLTHVDDMIAGRLSSYQMEKRYLRKNGAVVWALLNVSLVRGGTGEPIHFVSQVQDITARKQSELHRAALLGVSVALAESTSLEEAALRILEAVCTHLPWDFGSVWKVTSPDAPLQCLALWPVGDPAMAAFETATRSIPFHRGTGLPGQIWERARTRWIPDLPSAPNFPRGVAAARSGLHAAFGFPIILGGEVRGVVEFFSREVRDPDSASEELFASIGSQIGQVMERWRAGELLAANEALLRQFVRHTPAAVAMLDTSMCYLQASDNWMRDYHLQGQSVLGRCHYEVFPDIPERWKEIHRRVLAGAVERCDEDPFLRADGTTEWLQWEVRPWQKAGGEIGGLIFFTQVITERKRAEQAVKESLAEKEILLKEIHHRVKNNMQVISSMLNLQAGYVEDPGMRALFTDCQDRVQSMALIHEKLYRSQNLATIEFGAHVRDVAEILFRSHIAPTELRRVRLEVEADPATLDIDTSIPAGLVLNELLTNALKYAFPGQRAGVIKVTFKSEEPGKLLISVADNGVGMPAGLEEGRGRSLGLKMIRSLTRQISGTLEIRRNNGTECRVVFPGPLLAVLSS